MKGININYYRFLILSLLIIGIIIFISYFKNFLNENENQNIEGMNNNMSDLSASFCNTYSKDSSKLQNACSKLTSKNCKNIGCCVWANGKSCLAGGITGPTYKTDSSGKNLTIRNYYYMNKFYKN
jgi:hypothetical protein